MTFAELQRAVFDDLQYQAEPKPGVQDRVRRFLNEGLERVLRRPRLKSLRLAQMQFTSEAGRGFYAMKSIDRIDYLIDTVNGRKLEMRTRDWYRAQDPSIRLSGTPSVWIPEGFTPVERQPVSDALSGGYSTLIAVSDFAGDTTQRLNVRVIRGAPFYDIIDIKNPEWNLLHGTTPVTIFQGLGDDPGQIISITLDATCYGNIHLTDGGGRTLGILTSYGVDGSQALRMLGFRLYPTPSAPMLYHVEGQYIIPRMTHPEDTPPFSDNYHEMLGCYARARMYRKDGRLAQSQQEMAEFERFALDLTASIEYPVNYKPVAGKLSPGTHGWSDLGPWYPADRER